MLVYGRGPSGKPTWWDAPAVQASAAQASAEAADLRHRPLGRCPAAGWSTARGLHTLREARVAPLELHICWHLAGPPQGRLRNSAACLHGPLAPLALQGGGRMRPQPVAGGAGLRGKGYTAAEIACWAECLELPPATRSTRDNCL